MAFDPIQEDCHRLVLEALRRDNIPLTDAAAVERLMEQFTRNPAPLIVHDRDRAGHLIAKVVEAVDYRIPFIPDDTQAEQEETAAENTDVSAVQFALQTVAIEAPAPAAEPEAAPVALTFWQKLLKLFGLYKG